MLEVDLTPLEMDVRPLVMDYLRRFPPEVSELTFTNLFVWRKWRPVWLLEQDGLLALICGGHDSEGRHVLGPTLGGNPDPLALRSAVPDLMGYIRIPETTAGFLRQAGLTVTPDEDNSDYVYRTADLAELKGEKYHKKRNLVAQCLETHNCRYEALTRKLIPDCIASLDQWCFARREDLTPELAAEYQAIREMFTHYEQLELSGGAVLVNGCVQAYAVGEALTPTTAVCHFEKAASEVKGLGQVINQWFAANAVRQFEYVNREQDLGIPGLRHSKQSYYPHHQVHKFIARFP